MNNIEFPVVQIIGTQRSGSNLLRMMLDQQREIAAPHPPHVLKTFFPLLKAYGDLSKKANLTRLATDILELVAHNPVPWSHVPENAKELIEISPEPTLIGLWYGLYAHYTESVNARIICCKSMQNMEYHEQLEASGIVPRYIHLVRDGRDVACSFRKTMVGPKHVYFTAKVWDDDQRKALELAQALGSDRVTLVRYENLVTDPETVLRDLSKWLKVPYRASMMRYYESTASRTAASSGFMWQNLTKPVLKNNMGKYWHQFAPGEAEIFEAVAGEMLRHHGYPTEASPDAVFPATEADIKQFAKEDAVIQKQVIADAPPADREKREYYNNFVEKLRKQVK